jgi:hypothetical protein
MIIQNIADQIRFLVLIGRLEDTRITNGGCDLSANETSGHVFYKFNLENRLEKTTVVAL